MARVSQTKTAAPAKIRFVLLEAELQTGDLSQITQALVNALKQPDASQMSRRLTVSQTNSNAAVSGLEGETDESADTSEDLGEDVVASPPPGPRQPRKLRTPVALNMTLDGNPSFGDYVQGKQIASNLRKFLAVAAWFKEVKNVDSITVDHVYTCFRFMKWPSNIADFAQPLRDLKSKQLLESKGKGHYSITHLGLAHIDNADAE